MSNIATAPSNVTLDDHVEEELARFLSLEKPTSFFLFAGAGSGKTRSLVNALNYLAKTYRDTPACAGGRSQLSRIPMQHATRSPGAPSTIRSSSLAPSTASAGREYKG